MFPSAEMLGVTLPINLNSKKQQPPKCKSPKGILRVKGNADIGMPHIPVVSPIPKPTPNASPREARVLLKVPSQVSVEAVKLIFAAKQLLPILKKMSLIPCAGIKPGTIHSSQKPKVNMLPTITPAVVVGQLQILVRGGGCPLAYQARAIRSNPS